jgi:hypothetical protein
MKYELNDTELKVIADSTDAWKGETRAQSVGMASGLEVLFCGNVKNGNKTGRLCVRLDTRPELKDLITKWESAKAEQDRIEEELEARTIRVFLSSRGWGDYSSCEWVGDGTLPTAEIVKQCQSLLANGHDVDQPNQSEAELIEKIEKEKSKCEALAATEKEEEARSNEIAAKREELIASGARLATPKQMNVIANAREDWFDLFDGATSYGIYGPTEEQLQLMPIDEASRLVGEILEARKAGGKRG